MRAGSLDFGYVDCGAHRALEPSGDRRVAPEAPRGADEPTSTGGAPWDSRETQCPTLGRVCHFVCSAGVSKSVQVLFNGIEAFTELTLTVLK